MLTISITDILNCYKKPSWIHHLTPERAKNICGEKYKEHCNYYNLFWRPEDIEEDIRRYGKEFMESIYAGDYSKMIFKKLLVEQIINYDIIRFAFVEGKSASIDIKTFDHSSNIIHTLKLLDYDKFCEYTLKDVIYILSDAGQGYHINDALASEKYMTMRTISNSNLPVSFTFHWVDGKWKLRYITITTDYNEDVQ